MLSKSTRLNRIAEVRCLQGFRAARTFEPSAPDWLCLGRATSDESVWIPPGYLRTNGVFCTCKSSQPDRTVRKQQITQVNSRWVVCVFAKRASDTVWRERFWKVIYHNQNDQTRGALPTATKHASGRTCRSDSRALLAIREVLAAREAGAACRGESFRPPRMQGMKTYAL